MAIQIPLDLAHNPSFDPADFIVTPSNTAAHAVLGVWSGEKGHARALVGPEASGKSHLAFTWAQRVGAWPVQPGQSLAQLGGHRLFVVEDADRAGYDEVQLFHLFNWAREQGGAILFTARTAPSRWSISLPDLVSRVKTIPVLDIAPPDDMLLQLLLVKLFADRQIPVEPNVIEFASRRMERSFKAVHTLVAAVDRFALAEKKRVTLALVRRALEMTAPSEAKDEEENHAQG